MATADNIFAVITFLGLAVFLMVMTLTWNTISNEATELWDSPGGARIQGNMNAASSGFDWISVIMWFALHLGILLSAYFLRTHPVAIVAAIFIMVALCFIAPPISNAWEDLTVDDNLALTLDEYPKTNYIMSELPTLEVIWCIITIIVMFGLSKREGLI